MNRNSFEAGQPISDDAINEIDNKQNAYEQDANIEHIKNIQAGMFNASQLLSELENVETTYNKLKDNLNSMEKFGVSDDKYQKKYDELKAVESKKSELEAEKEKRDAAKKAEQQKTDARNQDLISFFHNQKDVDEQYHGEKKAEAPVANAANNYNNSSDSNDSENSADEQYQKAVEDARNRQAEVDEYLKDFEEIPAETIKDEPKTEISTDGLADKIVANTDTSMPGWNVADEAHVDVSKEVVDAKSGEDSESNDEDDEDLKSDDDTPEKKEGALRSWFNRIRNKFNKGHEGAKKATKRYGLKSRIARTAILFILAGSMLAGSFHQSRGDIRQKQNTSVEANEIVDGDEADDDTENVYAAEVSANSISNNEVSQNNLNVDLNAEQENEDGDYDVYTQIGEDGEAFNFTIDHYEGGYDEAKDCHNPDQARLSKDTLYDTNETDKNEIAKQIAENAPKAIVSNPETLAYYSILYGTVEGYDSTMQGVNTLGNTLRDGDDEAYDAVANSFLEYYADTLNNGGHIDLSEISAGTDYLSPYLRKSAGSDNNNNMMYTGTDAEMHVDSSVDQNYSQYAIDIVDADGKSIDNNEETLSRYKEMNGIPADENIKVVISGYCVQPDGIHVTVQASNPTGSSVSTPNGHNNSAGAEGTGTEGSEGTGTEGNEGTGTEGNEGTGSENSEASEGSEGTGTEGTGTEGTGTEGTGSEGSEGNEGITPKSGYTDDDAAHNNRLGDSQEHSSAIDNGGDRGQQGVVNESQVNTKQNGEQVAGQTAIIEKQGVKDDNGNAVHNEVGPNTGGQVVTENGTASESAAAQQSAGQGSATDHTGETQAQAAIDAGGGSDKSQDAKNEQNIDDSAPAQAGNSDAIVP